MEWITTNILDDVILGKIKNKSLKDKKPIPFAPIPYNKKGIQIGRASCRERV